MIIETHSYPRAAVIGNPSDGFYGKTIAFVFSNFLASVKLYETPELVIEPQQLDVTRFNSMAELVEDINFAGYYGGMRLLKATIKVFYEYCLQNNIPLDNHNFTMRYQSNIPLRLGLAGSSAIITAGMKALKKFFKANIPEPVLANLVLSVETGELGISAGLQDRVAQAFETPVFMDFDKDIMDRQGYGNYKKIDPSKFPPFYIAYRKNLSEGTEVVHNNLRARFEIGDKNVLDAVKRWGQITVEFNEAMERGDYSAMFELMNENFDLRRKTIHISQGNIEMVELARSTGASAKFTGSGGAIIGTYSDEKMYGRLETSMQKNGFEIIKPTIVTK